MCAGYESVSTALNNPVYAAGTGSSTYRTHACSRLCVYHLMENIVDIRSHLQLETSELFTLRLMQ